MYCKYYGFREKPFNITPNPRFLYLSKNHKEAFAHLLYGINNHSGFIEFTGEVGTGKTTVLRTIIEQLDDASHRTAIILNPCLSAVELLRSINREFGIPQEGLGIGALHTELNLFLLQENLAGRTVVLVIDEAQNLAPEVLEQIRLISNLETESDKLIQILLAGQPELQTLLGSPGLRQLEQRITVRYHLLPMDYEDSCRYIRHRLQVAGGGAWINFSQGATRRIFRFAKGSPRLINIACDRALLIAYTEDTGEISADIAARAIKEIRGPRPAWGRKAALAAAGASLLLAAGAMVQLLGPRAIAWLKSSRFVTATVAAPRKNTPPTAAPLPPHPAAKPAASPAAPLPAIVEPPAPTPAAAVKTGSTPWLNLPAGGEAAVAAVARTWRLSPADQPQMNGYRLGIHALARENGLETLPLRGKISRILETGAPLIIELVPPGTGESRYLALTGLSRNGASISPSLQGRSVVPLKELEAVHSGRCYLLWKNYQNIPVNLPPDAAGIDVIRLQILLTGAGYFRSEPSGVFDQATLEALGKFRRDHNMKENAGIDSQLLFLLYRSNGSFFTPSLKKRAAS